MYLNDIRIHISFLTQVGRTISNSTIPYMSLINIQMTTPRRPAEVRIHSDALIQNNDS